MSDFGVLKCYKEGKNSQDKGSLSSLLFTGEKYKVNNTF